MQYLRFDHSCNDAETKICVMAVTETVLKLGNRNCAHTKIRVMAETGPKFDEG